MASYRKAGWGDLQAIADLYEKAHDAEEAGVIHTGWLRGIYPTKETVEAGLKRGDMFVAEDEGRIIGAGVINHVQVDVYAKGSWKYPAPDEKVMVFHTLFVDPGCQHQGIGRGFIKYYEDYALSEGCPYLRFDTNEHNLRARALYQQLGYEEIGIVPTIFNGIPGVGLVLLEKYLG